MILDVQMDTAKVGEVVLHKKGLYWQICCRLNMDASGFYRLYARSEKGITDLGVCLYYDGYWGLNRRISAATFGDNPLSFQLKKNDNANETKICYVAENQCFEALAELTSGRFAIHNGKPAILWDQINS